jgi:glucose-6-phosphate 1-epimerase
MYFLLLYGIWLKDVSAIGIEGLASLQYIDKVAGKVIQFYPYRWSKVLHENLETVYISGPTDRVYKAAPPETTVVAHNKPVFTIHRFNFKDVVVWNPYTEGAVSMGDFEPKSGWKNMVPRFAYWVLRCRFVSRQGTWGMGWRFRLVECGRGNR